MAAKAETQTKASTSTRTVWSVQHPIKKVKEIYELTLCVIGANQLTQSTSAKQNPALAAKKAHLVRKATDLLENSNAGARPPN